MFGQNVLRVDVKDNAKVGKSIQGREFVTFQIMRNGLLRNAKPLAEFRLTKPALLDGGSKIFLNVFKCYHI